MAKTKTVISCAVTALSFRICKNPVFYGAAHLVTRYLNSLPHLSDKLNLLYTPNVTYISVILRYSHYHVAIVHFSENSNLKTEVS